jgi:hypothetical protein
MPLKPDGQPDRNKQGLDTLTAIPKWVDATISARKKHEKEMGQKQDRRARTRQESPRDQPSHSPSSAIDQLGQLSLQGEPSPTDVPFPAPVPGIADAPPHVPKTLTAAPQSPAPHNTAGPSKKTSVGYPLHRREFYVEITRRKVPKVAATSLRHSSRHSRRRRQVSPSHSPEPASPDSPHVESSHAGNEGTNAAKIVALEQRIAAFEAKQAARQAHLDSWMSDVDAWMLDVDAWRRQFAEDSE